MTKKQTGWHDGGKDNKCFAQKGQCPFGGESGTEGHFPPTPEGKKQLEEYIKNHHQDSSFSTVDNETEKSVDPEVAKFTELAFSPQSHVRVDVAMDPNIPEEVMLKIIAESDDSMQLQMLGQNEAITPRAQQALWDAATKSRDLAQRFSEHPWLPSLTMLASNKNTTPEILDKLAKHDLLGPVKNAAANTNTSEETLWHLVKNNFNPWVQKVVVENPNSTSEMLEELSNTGDVAVKVAIAENPKVSKETLMKLAKYPEDERKMILSLDIKDPGPVTKNVAVLTAIIENPKVTSDILDFVVEGGDKEIIELVKKHPQTTMKTLLKIAEKENFNDEEDDKES